MRASQVAVMSWMMSSLWLVAAVGSATTNVTSSTVGLLAVSALSTVTTQPKPDLSTSSHHSDSTPSTQEQYSRGLRAVTTATVAATTGSAYPTLDKSFSTNVYWLRVDLAISEDVDTKRRDFVAALETSLARAYSEGKARQAERAAAVQALLGNLNPDNDPLLSARRRKRAVTIDGNTVQVIDISRDADYLTSAVVVFYMAEGETSISAGESKAIFSELTLQEMTFYLQVVVKSFPTEFVEAVVVATTSPPDLTPLWIALGAAAGLALTCTGCCCCFLLCRVCCRPRPKSARGGPVHNDTLKMLHHQQKYPYRPYKTPDQTPRGYDVAKETDAGVAKETIGGGGGGSAVRLRSSGAGSTLKEEFHAVHGARLDADEYSSSSSDSKLSLHGNGLTVPRLEEDVFRRATSPLELSSGGRSGQCNGRLLPLRPHEDRSGDDLNPKSGHSTGRSARDSPHSLTTSHEAEELRRIYRKAQREVSRVLEPDIIPDQSDRTYAAPDRRPKSRGKSGKRGQKTEIQETDFGGMPSHPASSEARRANRPTKKQTPGHRRPEALQEARRRVHNLIDEAFSLVGLQKNAVSPGVVALAGNASPVATEREQPTNQTIFPRKILETLPSSAADIRGREFGSSPADLGRSQQDGTDADERTTRVVVVPVSHRPDAAANVVWSPYRAEDEFAQLRKSQQLTSVPGGVEDTPHPHSVALHLTMPRPVSIPETSREPWRIGFTSAHEQAGNGKGQMTNRWKLSASQEDLMQGRPSTSMRRPSTGSGRLSTDSDILKPRNTAPDDPYLDPYPKSSISDELNGVYTLSAHSDDPIGTQEDPYAMALWRSDGEPRSPKPESGEGDMLSTLSKERRVGKPVADGYDEFDVSRGAAGRDKSGQLVAAIRDELVRLAKKRGQHGSAV